MNRINFKKFPATASPILEEIMSDFFNTGVSSRPNGLPLKHPSVNIIKHEDKTVLEIAAPGLEKEDFKLEVEKDQLIISVEKENSENTEEVNYSRQEFNYMKFKRSFHLPETINTNDIGASYHAGILSITLPKKAEAVQKTIAIAVN